MGNENRDAKPPTVIFSGRGCRMPIVTETADADRGTVRIRVDCERNDEFWAEIYLTRSDLERLLAKLNVPNDEED